MVDLKVETGDLGRPHAVQREAPIVVGVDQLLRGRRRLREDAEPCVRILPLVGAQRTVGNGGPAHTVEAVTTGDEVAAKLVPLGVACKPNRRRASAEIVQANVVDLEVQRSVGRKPGGDQILNQLVLAVDGQLAAGQLGERDPVSPPSKSSSMPWCTMRSRCIRSASPTSVSRSTVPCSSTPARMRPLDVFTALPLQHHGVDAQTVQQMCKHKAGRTGSDDPDLCAHASVGPFGYVRRSSRLNATSSTVERHHYTPWADGGDAAMDVANLRYHGGLHHMKTCRMRTFPSRTHFLAVNIWPQWKAVNGLAYVGEQPGASASMGRPVYASRTPGRIVGRIRLPGTSRGCHGS